MMTFSIAQLIDLALRVAGCGQLLLLALLFAQRPITERKFSLYAFTFCAGAYLCLTAPIPDAHYGALRGPLLLFTDAFAYSVWLLAALYFRDNFSVKHWPKPLQIGLACYAIGFCYLFLVLKGQGWLHDANHLLSIALMLHVVYMALAERRDDLADAHAAVPE